jgi:hypothetical protein
LASLLTASQYSGTVSIMRTSPIVAAASFCVLMGCSSPEPEDPAGVTYHQDVKPIVDARCGGCHGADGIAPFALTTYAEVAAHGPVARLTIEAGLMPPWPPNPDCNEYVADRSLSAAEQATFAAWVEAGMPEGDPARPGPPLEVERVELSRVDLTMAMSAPYTTRASADNPDEYRCFVLPFPESFTDTRYVTGFRAVPGNPKVVHHVIAFYAEPGMVDQYRALDAAAEGDGYPCFGGSGGPAQSMVGGWAPGGLGSDFPPGTGLAIEPGAAVILQLHYNLVAAGVEPDQTEIWLKLDDQVDQVAQIMPWANPSWLSGNMLIPAGQADVVHSFQFDASFVMGGDFTIYSAATHQHNLGSRNRVTIERGGGGSECLLQIDAWNFHWQGSYGLRQPVTFRSGDQLRLQCHWDNSPENQPLVGGQQLPPRDVNWGEGTGDEMCVAFFYVTPN